METDKELRIRTSDGTFDKIANVREKIRNYRKKKKIEFQSVITD